MYKKILFIIIFLLLSISSFSKINISWQNVISEYRDCQMIDSVNLVIVGNDGKVIISSDNGKNWIWSETGSRANFYTTSFLNKDIGAAAGDSGIIVLTSDGGKSWMKKTLSIDTINAVKVINENLE